LAHASQQRGLPLVDDGDMRRALAIARVEEASGGERDVHRFEILPADDAIAGCGVASPFAGWRTLFFEQRVRIAAASEWECARHADGVDPTDAADFLERAIEQARASVGLGVWRRGRGRSERERRDDCAVAPESKI